MKIARAGIVASVTLLVATACLAGDMKVSVETPEFDKAKAPAIIEAFKDACRPLGSDYWDDIEEVSLEVKKEVVSDRQSRGWTTSFHLALKYSEHPTHGPAFAPGIGVLAGHTLHYQLGGGKKPGYLAIKRSSQYLCGLPSSENGNDVFKAVPAFMLLDQ